MVHLVGIGVREFSVGRFASCRSSFTLLLAALGLSQPAVVYYSCTNLKMQTHGKQKKPPHRSHTTKPHQPSDSDPLQTESETMSHALTRSRPLL